MISLGNISRGAEATAKQISKNALEHGRVAIFIDETGDVSFVPHYDRQYGAALATLSTQLVGIYEGNASGTGVCHPTQSVYAITKSDLEHWMGFISIPAGVCAMTEQRAAA